MPRRMHAHRGLAQPSRLQVVALVMEQPGLSPADISAQTGLHANTLRDHVRVLTEEGLIRSEVEHRAMSPSTSAAAAGRTSSRRARDATPARDDVSIPQR